MKIRDFFENFDMNNFAGDYEKICIYKNGKCVKSIYNVSELETLIGNNSEVDIKKWSFDYCSYGSDEACLNLYIENSILMENNEIY